MAATKTKKSSPAPRVRKIKKSNFNLSAIRTNAKNRWDKHPSLYPLGVSLVVIILLLAALFIFRRGFFVAGTVNSRIVTTPEFYVRLAKSGGEATFDSIVRDTLIRQEAEKKNVTVSSSEIDDRIKKIEDRLGGKEALTQALSQSKVTLNELREQVSTQALAEKILENDIKVSEEEITKFMEENKQTTEGQSRENIKEQLQSQKFNEKFATWYEELKKNSQINKYF
jgi:parvulin-like peptidyl-prolyl isomerase